MRRFPAFLAVLLAAAVAAVFVPGCSSGQSTALGYIEKAREQTKDVAVNQEKLKEKGEELSTLFQQLSDPPTAEDAQKMKQFIAELATLVEATNKAAQKTRAEYEKVLDLKGVDDCKAYARNKIETLKVLDELASLLKQYWAIYNQAFEEYLAGVTVDEDAIKAQTDPIIEQRNKLNSRLEELNKEAADLAEKLEID